MKKNKWLKLWNTEDIYDEDEGNGKFWFQIEKDGKVFVPSAADAQAIKYKLEDGNLLVDKNGLEVAKKKVNSKDYFFNADGEMVSKFIKVTKSGSTGLAEGMYYFGGADDGAMKTGAQSIKDNNDDTYKFYFETKGNKSKGIVGNKSGKLYYHGQLVTADDYRYELAELTLEGKDGNDVVYTFIVNQNGAIQHSKTECKEDSDVLIDARGTYNETTKKYEDIPSFSGSNELKDSLTATEAAKLNSINTNTIDVNSYVPDTTWTK